MSLTCSQISVSTVGQASCDCSTESSVAVCAPPDVAEEHQRDQDRRQDQHQHGLARQAAQSARHPAAGGRGGDGRFGARSSSRQPSRPSTPVPASVASTSAPPWARARWSVRRAALSSCSARMCSVTAAKPMTPRYWSRSPGDDGRAVPRGEHGVEGVVEGGAGVQRVELLVVEGRHGLAAELAQPGPALGAPSVVEDDDRVVPGALGAGQRRRPPAPPRCRSAAPPGRSPRPGPGRAA